MNRNTVCPVCSSDESTALLTLNKFPVYQHPIPAGVKLDPPFEVNIEYALCSQCGQAYQKHYDRMILENIYKQHYYTPRPGHIGKKFTQDFVDFFQDCIGNDSGKYESALEIGCSAAEVLSEIKQVYPFMKLTGVEPNDETRQQAQAAGFSVYSQFFDRMFAENFERKVDIVYSRHVIEHVFDFDEFISSSSDILSQHGAMFIETPGLDWSIEHESRAPFHVEHVSLFCRHSLQVLLARHGWYIQKIRISDVGNMMAFCTRDKIGSMNFTLPAYADRFQSGIDAQKEKLARLIAGKKVAMWGAGAGGRALMSFLSFTPDVILDGNPNKSERVFAGYEHCRIEPAERWIQQHQNVHADWILVVASSFYDEISSSLHQFGWQGDVTYPYRY